MIFLNDIFCKNLTAIFHCTMLSVISMRHKIFHFHPLLPYCSCIWKTNKFTMNVCLLFCQLINSEKVFDLLKVSVKILIFLIHKSKKKKCLHFLYSFAYIYSDYVEVFKIDFVLQEIGKENVLKCPKLTSFTRSSACNIRTHSFDVLKAKTLFFFTLIIKSFT